MYFFLTTLLNQTQVSSLYGSPKTDCRDIKIHHHLNILGLYEKARSCKTSHMKPNRLMHSSLIQTWHWLPLFGVRQRAERLYIAPPLTNTTSPTISAHQQRFAVTTCLGVYQIVTNNGQWFEVNTETSVWTSSCDYYWSREWISQGPSVLVTHKPARRSSFPNRAWFTFPRVSAECSGQKSGSTKWLRYVGKCLSCDVSIMQL